MFCRYCGKSIAEDSDFCTYCGKSLFEKSNDTSAEEIATSISAPCKPKNNFFTNNISLLVTASCYIALGVFLFFNIKMAPFYSGWKFLTYINCIISIFYSCYFIFNYVKNSLRFKS